MNNWATVLRESNLRATPQRLVILEAMEGLDCHEHHRHVTARDVFDAVKQKLPGMNVTTVYRTLEGLNQLGIIQSMACGKQVSFSLHRSEHRHGHLSCKNCGRLETIDIAPIHILAEQIEQMHGFVVEDEHVTLSGRCRACFESEQTKRHEVAHSPA